MNRMKQANATATTRAAARRILWLNFMFLVIKSATAQELVRKGGAICHNAGLCAVLFIGLEVPEISDRRGNPDEMHDAVTN